MSKRNDYLAIAGIALIATLCIVPLASAATPPDTILTSMVKDIQVKVNWILGNMTSAIPVLNDVQTKIGWILGNLTSGLTQVRNDISSVNTTVNDINATVNELGDKINGDTLRTTGIQTLSFPENNVFYKLWVNSTANAPFEVKAIYVQACNPSDNSSDYLTVQWGPIYFTRAPYTGGAISEILLVDSPTLEDVVPGGECWYMHELMSAYGATINPTIATGQMWVYVKTLTYNQTAEQSINVEVIVESSADVALSLTASGD